MSSALDGLSGRTRHLEGLEWPEVGHGEPTHEAAESTQYWDADDDCLWINYDGSTGWYKCCCYGTSTSTTTVSTSSSTSSTSQSTSSSTTTSTSQSTSQSTSTSLTGSTSISASTSQSTSITASTSTSVTYSTSTSSTSSSTSTTLLLAHALLGPFHSDTLTDAPTRGSLIYVPAAGLWDELNYPGGAGYAFTTKASDTIWDRTPAWTGLHTFGAGWILSGGLAGLAGIADALVLDNDGDTTISAPTDDQIDVEIAGADDFTFTANSLNVLGSSYITMADDTWIGLGAAAGRLVFDSTPAPNVLAFLTCNVGIGTLTVPHGGVGAALLALEGANASTAGPHVQFTTASDDYPLLQILPLTHDNITIMFDAYYDGAAKSSDAGSNFSILKCSDQLQFRYEAGIAVGNAVTWGIGLTVTALGDVSVGTSLSGAQLFVDQVNPTGAQPVLELIQRDVDREFIYFIGEAAAADLTRSIVDEGDQGSEVREGWLKVTIEDDGEQVADGTYFIPFYSLSA